MRFVIINEGTSASPVNAQITAAWLAELAAACEVQLNRDLAAAWGGSYAVRAGSGPTDIEPTEIVFAFRDTLPDAPGAVAYHDDEGNAVPFGLLGLSTCSTLDDVSTGTSHELCETAGDAFCNAWRDDGAGHEWAQELCLSGDTLVQLEGCVVPISTLAERGGFFTVRCADAYGRSTTARAGHARRTAREVDTVAVIFSDGSLVRCTPEHSWLMETGIYLPAMSLTPGARLLQHMTPGFPSARAIDRREAYPQASGADFSGFGNRTELRYLGLREPRSAMSLTPLSAISRHSIFSGGVPHIVGMRSEEQMIGAHASGHVAGMAHLQPRRGRFAVRDFERQSMGQVHSSRVSDLAVARSRFSSYPKPTALTPDDSTPEPIDEGRAAAVVGGETSIQTPVAAHASPMGGAEALSSYGTLASRGNTGHAKVVDRVEAAGKCDVFDLTVPRLRNFAIGVGVYAHNCDAVESDSYTINGIAVSDFLLPAFFAAKSPGPYRFLTTIGQGPDLPGPFVTAPGGYQIQRQSGGGETQVDGRVRDLRLAAKKNFLSRTYRRGARV